MITSLSLWMSLVKYRMWMDIYGVAVFMWSLVVLNLTKQTSWHPPCCPGIRRNVPWMLRCISNWQLMSTDMMFIVNSGWRANHLLNGIPWWQIVPCMVSCGCTWLTKSPVDIIINRRLHCHRRHLKRQMQSYPFTQSKIIIMDQEVMSLVNT